MMGYTEEAKAEQDYWFDVHGEVFSNEGFTHSNVAILADNSKGWYTYFGGNAEYVLGIENLPLWPALEFNGQYPTAAALAISRMISDIAIQHNDPTIVDFHTWALADPNNQWLDIALGYVSQYDAQTASNELTTDYQLGLTVGTDPTVGIYYYQAESHRTTGQRDYTHHLSLPVGGVYYNAALSTYTYEVYNPATTAQTVYVYDSNNNVVDSFTAVPQGMTFVLRGQVIPTIVVTPNVSSTLGDLPVTFLAVTKDQIGNTLAIQPAYTWSLSGSGSLVANGSSTTYRRSTPSARPPSAFPSA